jgi:hypothetical protein
MASRHQDAVQLIEQRVQASRAAGLMQCLQQVRGEQYRQLAASGQRLPDFSEVEFRSTSQNGEDGIIHYIFSLIGTESRKAVEICAGDGTECNSANLILNHGWEALLVDGDPESIERGQAFYGRCQDTFSSPPRLVASWLTRENVNAVVAGNQFAGDIDFLSLDIDGMDFWIWKALDVVTPRLVLLEFNPVWGPEASVAVPYDPEFRIDYTRQPYYCSASLHAFVKLARTKGYRLVGVQRLGFNAFFLRDGVGEAYFPGIDPVECFRRSPRLRRWQRHWIPSPEDRPEFGRVVEV